MTVKPTEPIKETKKAYFYEYNGDDAQIKSLLAVFTQDTAECFVKV